MPRIPGILTEVNPRLVTILWDPSDPPVVNGCVGNVGFHAQGCDNECEKHFATESETALLNEYRNWEKARMNTAGIHIDVFETAMQSLALIDVMLEELGISQETLDEAYRRRVLKKLIIVREANEDNVRREKLGLPPKNAIILPNGEVLH